MPGGGVGGGSAKGGGPVKAKSKAPSRSKSKDTNGPPDGLPETPPLGMPQAKGLTAEDVLGLWAFRRNQSDEQGLRRFIREVRTMVDLQDPVRIPHEYKTITQEVRTPFMRDAWERIASSLCKDTPIITVEPRDEEIASRRAANIASRFLQQAFHLMDKERNDDLVYQSARALVRDSESVLKVVHRPDAWANFPVRGGQEEMGDGQPESADTYLKRTRDFKKSRGVRLPFASRVVDRLETYFGGGEYGDEWVIEYGEYPLPYRGQLLYGMAYDRDSKQWINPRNMLAGRPYAYGEYQAATAGWDYTLSSGSAGRCRKWEYWDKDWWAVVIDGHMAPDFPKRNPYAPWLPYFRAVSSPALYSLRYLVPGLNNLLTMKQNWAYLTAFPTPVLEAVATGDKFSLTDLPLGDDGTKPKFTWRPGKVSVPPEGYRFDFIKPPPGGADVDALINIFRELIDIAGISSIFRGMSPGSRTPGYAINQLMAAANLEFRMMGEALSRQLESACEFVLHCVQNVINDEVFVLSEFDE